MRMKMLVTLCAALALTVGVATATAGSGGNAANAKKCQKGGWMTLSANGLPFANEAACTSTGAKGGVLTTSFLTLTSGPCTVNAESYPYCLTIAGAGLKPNTSPDTDLTIVDMFDPSFPWRVGVFPDPVTPRSA